MRVNTPEQISNLRESGKILGAALEHLAGIAQPGLTLEEIDSVAESIVAKHADARPAFKGYEGFPNAICLSVNDVVVHGIPTDYSLQEGDILTLDFGIDYRGMITDAAVTVPIGKVDHRAQNLIAATRLALHEGINQARQGNYIADIGAAVEKVAQEHELGVVRDMVGHGVGQDVHEPPQVPNYTMVGLGLEKIPAHQSLAIEPMFTLGAEHINIDNDGWTARTTDSSLAAQFEHTILVTPDGSAPEVLTANAIADE